MRLGVLISEKRATWHKGSKDTTKREKEVLAMSQDLKEHVEEARREKEKFQTYFGEWKNNL